MKYELVNEDTIVHNGVECVRIRATQHFGDVKKGDLGGYLARTAYLAATGSCWLYDNAVLGDGASLTLNATARGYTIIEHAIINGRVEINNSKIIGSATNPCLLNKAAYISDSTIEQGAYVSGDVVLSNVKCGCYVRITGNACVYDSVLHPNINIWQNVIVDNSVIGCSIPPWSTVYGSVIDHSVVINKPAHIRDCNLFDNCVINCHNVRVYGFVSTNKPDIIQEDYVKTN